MTTAKPWYLSRTIWASVVTVLNGGAGLVGVPTGVIDDGALTDTILQLVTAISGLVAIFGRLAARDTIGR
jgi:hypothetical protein